MVLSAGAHRFVAERDLLVDDLWVEALAQGSRPGAVSVRSQTRSSAEAVEVRASGSGAIVLIGGRSFHPRWTAASGKASLGRPVPIDAGLAWEHRLRGSATYRLRFGPQRVQDVATLLTLLGLGVCVGIIVRRSP